jgi:hypothetical protein
MAGAPVPRVDDTRIASVHARERAPQREEAFEAAIFEMKGAACPSGYKRRFS